MARDVNEQRQHMQRIADATEDIQALQHSAVFDAWVENSIASSSTSLGISESAPVDANRLPPAFSQLGYLPDDFALTSLYAEIHNEANETWLFSSSFAVQNRQYRLFANEQHGQITVSSSHGENIRAQLSDRDIIQFMIALALSEEVAMNDIAGNIDESRPRVPQAMSGLMNAIASRVGIAQTNKISYELSEYGTEAILAEIDSTISPENEKERLRVTVAEVDLDSDSHTREYSHEAHQSYRSNKRPKTEFVAYSATSRTDPSDILFRSKMGETPNIPYIKYPETKTSEYGHVALVLMSRLNPYLRPYRDYDHLVRLEQTPEFVADNIPDDSISNPDEDN